MSFKVLLPLLYFLFLEVSYTIPVFFVGRLLLISLIFCALFFVLIVIALYLMANVACFSALSILDQKKLG
jgi:hypothetical protein